MEHLRRFSLWFVSGLGLSFGVVLGSLAFDEWQRRRAPPLFPDMPISTASFSEVEPISLTTNLTVAARLTSSASTDIIVDPRLELIRDNKLAYSCDGDAVRVNAASKSIRVQLECRKVLSANVPPGTTFRMVVVRVVSGT